MAAPKLRFKEFDRDWTTQSLGNVTDITKLAGYEFTKHINYQDSGEIIALRGLNVKGNNLVLEDVKYIDNSDLSMLSRSKLYIDDLLFTYVGTIGEVALIPENDKFYLAPNVCRIRRVNKNILSKYLMFLFSNENFKKNQIDKYTTKSSQPALSMENIRKFEIVFPSVEEQTKIAYFLSAVDEKISQLNRKNELLSQYKQGMMQKLFSQQTRFKADDGSEFGEWEEVKFSGIFNFHQTNSYSRALLAEYGEIMNIHYGDIHTKFSMLFDVNKESVPFLNDEVDTSKIAKEQFLKVGDLVIADASEDYKDIGKSIEVISLNNQKVVAGLHTYIARPVKPFALGFCGYMMQTFPVREQIKKLATGISVLGISKTNLGKVELKVPSLEEQTKIANFLSAIDQKIEVVAQQIEQAKQWKKGLLQQMFV